MVPVMYDPIPFIPWCLRWHWGNRIAPVLGILAWRMWVKVMTSSNGNIFRVTDPLYWEFTGQRWIPLTKASDPELWCFLWSTPWINGWVNNREAGYLRRHRAHYDVIVIKSTGTKPQQSKHHEYFYGVFQNVRTTHLALQTMTEW